MKYLLISILAISCNTHYEAVVINKDHNGGIEAMVNKSHFIVISNDLAAWDTLNMYDTIKVDRSTLKIIK